MCTGRVRTEILSPIPSTCGMPSGSSRSPGTKRSPFDGNLSHERLERSRLELRAVDHRYAAGFVRSSDAFQSTDLEAVLGAPSGCDVIVTGCDTEFCIDSTVRSALARGYRVTVPEDGHSLIDRAHLSAEQIIEHHNAIWSTPGALAGSLAVCKCSEILV